MNDTNLIDEKLIDDLHNIAEGRPLSEMVTAALQAYIKSEKKRQLVGMFGTIDYFDDVEHEYEAHLQPS